MNLIQEWQPDRSLAVAMRCYYDFLLQQLMPEEAFQKIEELGKRFSVHSSSFWGYEIPLSSSKNAADFLLCIHEPEKLSQLFSDDSLNHSQNGFKKDHQSAFQKFACHWMDNKKKLKETVSNIWFEYDCPAHSGEEQTPNFFYAPQQGINSLALLYTTHYIFQIILHQDIEKRAYSLLLSCIRLLEGKGWISQIGMMLARKELSFRLFIQDIPKYGIIPYLKKLRYKYVNNNDLQTQLDFCYKYCRRVALDIDILFEVGEKIGLECYFDSNEQAMSFLHWLCENQICHPDKYLFLKAYLEDICFNKSKEFQTFFSHVKLVYNPGAGFAAKAYIGYAETGMARQIIRTKPVKMNSYA